MPSSSRPIAPEDRRSIRSRREDQRQRSLRDCTTLTHYFADEVDKRRVVPVLTSHVQWNTVHSDNDDGMSTSIADDEHDARHVGEEVGQSYPSPVMTEIDELTQSDGELSRSPTRPPTSIGRCEVPSSEYVDAGSPRSFTDSSDTERRNPNFPGGRSIINDNASSGSPSPPTAPSSQLEPASPSLDSPPQHWRPSTDPDTSSSLDLRLYPKLSAPTSDDRNARIGIWRVDSAPHLVRPGPSALARYGASGLNHNSTYRSTSYSPSLTGSSAPPSPPPVLPPIRPHPSLHSRTLPSVTSRAHGPLYWKTQELSPPNILKRLSPHGHHSADECEYSRHDPTTNGNSPHTHMHNLHDLPQSYPLGLPITMSQQKPSVARNKNEWKDHAQIVQGPNDHTEFRCVYRVAETGAETDYCGYTAKRHLVKRHIETRHLQFKDHICPYCQKAFPQRVSLNIHINRHTGDRPHECRYDGCDKKFSDPARRHKHMVEAHGYNPQGPRKRHRTIDSYHANSHFETLAPWVAKSDESKHEATQ